MYKFVLYRNTIPGIVFVLSAGLLADATLLTKVSTQPAWSIAFAVAASPIVGYVAGQLVRSIYEAAKRRPNETKIRVTQLYDGIKEIAATTPINTHERARLSALLDTFKEGKKDLHRFLWFTCANQTLRERSETYWDRYYTNEIMILAASAGAIAGASLSWSIGHDIPVWVFAIILGFEMSLASVLVLDQVKWGMRLAFVLCIADASLLLAIIPARVLAFPWHTWAFLVLELVVFMLIVRVNRAYLRVSANLENAWIRLALIDLKKQPNQFLRIRGTGGGPGVSPGT